jgi:hypothetical protein
MTSQRTFLSLDFYTRKVNVTKVNISLLPLFSLFSPLLQREMGGQRDRERRKNGHERQKEKERERENRDVEREIDR